MMSLNKKRGSEWSTKRIITRVIMYPFCMAIAIAGLYMITDPISYRNMGTGIFAIIFGVGYILVDILIIAKESGKQNKK